MSLRLRIENVPSLTSGDPIEVVLEQHGLVIGRAAHADWTLPDPRNHVSSVHCEIDYRDGGYFLTDRSTNGTFVNGGTERPTRPVQLRDGDLVQIGQYQIRIEEISEGGNGSGRSAENLVPSYGAGLDWTQGEAGPAVVSKPMRSDTFGREPARPVFQSSDDPLMRAYAPPAAATSSGNDPFGIGGGSASPAAAQSDPFGMNSPAAPHFAPSPPPPPASADPFGIGGSDIPRSSPAAPAAPPPSDPWAALQNFGTVDFGSQAAAVPSPPPPAAIPAAISPVPSPAPAFDAGPFERFLAAAGLARSDIGAATPTAVLDAAGALLRQTADGLIRMLDARTRVRHQFGVGGQVTTYQRSGNNPLKWTRSPETALKQMIGEPESGFLPGPQAIRGAFEDLQAHELALIAAMQEAMQATIERFAPDAIKKRISARGWLNSVLPGSREATLWRAYESEFRAFADESEAAYLDVFAKQFKKAYERNISKSG